MTHFRLLTLAALFVTIMTSSAQTMTGELIGRIQNADGLPIEGANIIIRSDALQGTKGNISMSNGGFAFIGLPVGTYTMSVTHISYRALDVKEIKVSLGSSTNLGSILLQEGGTTLDEVVISDYRDFL